VFFLDEVEDLKILFHIVLCIFAAGRGRSIRKYTPFFLTLRI
jgi:hypothetical protein